MTPTVEVRDQYSHSTVAMASTMTMMTKSNHRSSKAKYGLDSSMDNDETGSLMSTSSRHERRTLFHVDSDDSSDDSDSTGSDETDSDTDSDSSIGSCDSFGELIGDDDSIHDEDFTIPENFRQLSSGSLSCHDSGRSWRQQSASFRNNNVSDNNDKRRKHVCFAMIEVIELCMMQGDHPECKAGPAVQLSSDEQSRREYRLAEYELARPRPRSRRELYLTETDRSQIIRHSELLTRRSETLGAIHNYRKKYDDDDDDDHTETTVTLSSSYDDDDWIDDEDPVIIKPSSSRVRLHLEDEDEDDDSCWSEEPPHSPLTIQASKGQSMDELLAYEEVSPQTTTSQLSDVIDQTPLIKARKTAKPPPRIRSAPPTCSSSCFAAIETSPAMPLPPLFSPKGQDDLAVLPSLVRPRDMTRRWDEEGPQTDTSPTLSHQRKTLGRGSDRLPRPPLQSTDSSSGTDSSNNHHNRPVLRAPPRKAHSELATPSGRGSNFDQLMARMAALEEKTTLRRQQERRHSPRLSAVWRKQGLDNNEPTPSA